MIRPSDYLLLIDCPDEPGLVSKAAHVVYKQGMNIEDQQEFVERSSKHFFMRTHLSGDVQHESILQTLKTLLPQNSSIRLFPCRKKRIIVFVTKEAHCLGDLLIRHEDSELQAQILAVISNQPDLEHLVGKFSIPFHFISHKNLSRPEHEQLILDVLSSYTYDNLVLAKYMRILTPQFVSPLTHKIINIHHSFLPAFMGAKPYHRAFERGVKLIGATAHFVTDGLDEGPIISQGVAPVNHRKTVLDMISAGRNVEKVVLADALRLVFEDRVFVHNNKTIVFD